MARCQVSQDAKQRAQMTTDCYDHQTAPDGWHSNGGLHFLTLKHSTLPLAYKLTYLSFLLKLHFFFMNFINIYNIFFYYMNYNTYMSYMCATPTISLAISNVYVHFIQIR